MSELAKGSCPGPCPICLEPLPGDISECVKHFRRCAQEQIAVRDKQIANLIKRGGELQRGFADAVDREEALSRESRELRRERDWLHAESNLRGKDVENLRAELRRVEKALQEYPLVPKETFIGRDEIADKVTWLARRATMLDRPRKEETGASLNELWRIVLADLNRSPETPFLVPYEVFEAKGVEVRNFLLGAADFPNLIVSPRPFGVYIARSELGLRHGPILHYGGQKCERSGCDKSGWVKANQVQGDPKSAILLCNEHFKERMER